MIASLASLDLPSSAEAAPPLDYELQYIHAAQAGDMTAFEWLVRRHEERVLVFCRRWLRCEEDAREVCQDTFVRAWQALPEFAGRAKLSTWLYQITLNLCRDRASLRATRQKEKTVTLEDAPDAALCPQLSPDTSAQWQSDLERLELGISLLPEKLKAALLLTALEGLSYAECAQVLNVSIRGIEGRIYRARQMLMQWWEQDGSLHSTGK